VKDVPSTDEQRQGGFSLGGVRGRFAEVIERQLDLFLGEHAGLIHDTEAALRAYNDASREEAEERYGDFLDLVETGTDELIELRETYAATLDTDAALEYEAVFNDLARKRLPRFGLELD
jgi:hypothetical protein